MTTITRPLTLPKKVSGVLRLASDFIEARGLHRGALAMALPTEGKHPVYDSNGPLDVMGAISLASTGTVTGFSDLTHAARKVLRNAAGEPLGHWNDSKRRTPAEIVATLRLAAQIEYEAGR